jgi:putative tryptophan/tyrosine transport system substrate-binding protein
VVLGALRLRSLENAFSAIRRERPDGFLVSPSDFIARHQARIIDFSVKARLPTMYSRSHFVDAGGLMSYDVNHADLYRRAAIYIDKPQGREAC